MEILAMREDPRRPIVPYARKPIFEGLLRRDDETIVPFKWGWEETQDGRGVWDPATGKILPDAEYMFVLENLGRSEAVCRVIEDEDGNLNDPEFPIITEFHSLFI